MTIDSFESILAPPKSLAAQTPSAELWLAIEERLGIALPADYKAFILRFGTGCIDEFLWVYSPFTSNENLNLLTRAAQVREGFQTLRMSPFDEVPYPLFPEHGGLLSWGATANGDFLFWRTQGAPDRWSIVVAEARAPLYQEFALQTTDFLSGLLQRKVVCSIFPSDFPSGEPRFVPTQGSTPSE